MAEEQKEKSVSSSQTLSDKMGDMKLEARQEFSLLPNCTSFHDVMNLCTLVSQSDLVPKAYKDKPADIFVAAEYGQEIGLKFMQAVQNIAVINGRPALPSDIKLAMVRARGLLESHQEASIEEIKKTGIARCRMKRKDDPEIIEHTFTIEDAKMAGLWERMSNDGRVPTPWVTYKYRMLQLKPRDMCLRDKFGDVFKGLKSVEEEEEIALIETAGKPETMMIEQSQPLTLGQSIVTQSAEQQSVQGLTLPPIGQKAAQGVAPLQKEEAKQDIQQEQQAKQPATDTETALSATSATIETEESAQLRAITALEVTLMNTAEGKKAFKVIWGSFKLSPERFGTDGGAQYLPLPQRTFYARALQQALDGVGKPGRK